jgi:VWFA-related protein
MIGRLFLAALLVTPAPAATRVLVTVVEAKSGRPVIDLKAADFAVLDDRTPRQVENAAFTTAPVDVMFLLDTSLVGGMVQPLAENLIGQLGAKEQMAIVSFASSADLIQDFTSSRDLLRRALSGVKYGNTPRVLDAVYAAMDGGFAGAVLRRTVLLLTAGLEGPSSVSLREVIRLAHRNGVSIFPVYMQGYERSLFESLARPTGGASFNLGEMRKSLDGPPGARIFEAMRGQYTLTLGGNLSLGERLKVEVRRPAKLFVSALPLD